MYLLKVIPIARGITKENLTYLSPNKVNVGSLITIPLRKKLVKALVVESKEARNEKMAIKSAPFILRKVQDLKERSFLSKEMMDFIKSESDYYATSTGSFIHGFINKHVLE